MVGGGTYKVLVGELLSVDGLSSGSVALGEVSSLEHELGDHAVEARSLEVKRQTALSLQNNKKNEISLYSSFVSSFVCVFLFFALGLFYLALFSGAQGGKVGGSLGHHVVEELELDAARGLSSDRNVEKHVGARSLTTKEKKRKLFQKNKNKNKKKNGKKKKKRRGKTKKEECSVAQKWRKDEKQRRHRHANHTQSKKTKTGKKQKKKKNKKQKTKNKK